MQYFFKYISYTIILVLVCSQYSIFLEYFVRRKALRGAYIPWFIPVPGRFVCREVPGKIYTQELHGSWEVLCRSQGTPAKKKDPGILTFFPNFLDLATH